MTSVAKEKFCTLMCPYSKFQSMMFNNDTIMVHYNSNRGEPRGSIKDNNEGDCIDCNECVNVCPTNIDIRNGIQIECISCGLCIDACNKIMDKVSKPRNLIEYNNYDHTILSKYNKFSLLFRKKNLFLLLAIIIIFISSILYYNTRSSFNVTIEQIRNPLFIKMTNGAIRNKYKVHVFNKSDKQQTFTFKLNNNAYLIETNKKQITIDGFKSKKIILFITQKSKLENHLNNSENLVLEIYNNQAIKIESIIKFITNKK